MEPPSGRFFFSRPNDQQLRVKSASGFLRRSFEPYPNRVGARRFDQRALPVLAAFAEFTRPVADLNCFLAIISFTGDLHVAPLAENPRVRIASSWHSRGKTYWSESGVPQVALLASSDDHLRLRRIRPQARCAPQICLPLTTARLKRCVPGRLRIMQTT
jgi:hypothetical protein